MSPGGAVFPQRGNEILLTLLNRITIPNYEKEIIAAGGFAAHAVDARCRGRNGSERRPFPLRQRGRLFLKNRNTERRRPNSKRRPAGWTEMSSRRDSPSARPIMRPCAPPGWGRTMPQELLERFLFEYPFSIYANDVRFALGVLLHEAGDYRAAYDRYRSVDPYELDFSQFDEYNFRTGYAAFMCGDTDKAYGYFRNVSSDPLYKPHATYYVAYIDYSRGQFGDAKRGFQSIASEPAYEPVIPFYLLQIEFRQGNYDYVIENGVPLLAKSTEERQREISRIVSEAYFHRGAYDERARLYEQLCRAGRRDGARGDLSGRLLRICRTLVRRCDRTAFAGGFRRGRTGPERQLPSGRRLSADGRPEKGPERVPSGFVGRFRSGDPRGGAVQLRQVALRTGRRRVQ